MPITVHDPKLLITGTLADSASGSSNIYEYGDTGASAGRKLNSSSLGASASYKWGAEDANLLGHVVTDIVNFGTVVLFASASTALSSNLAVSSAFTTSGSRWDAASSSFSSTQVLYLQTSQSVGGWTGTGTYTGTLAGFFTGSGSQLSLSGAVMWAALSASTAAIIAAQMQGQVIDLQNSSSDYSSSLYGNGSPGYTGALAPWASGVVQTLVDLSSSIFTSGHITSSIIVSGALVEIGQLFLGTSDLPAIMSGSGSWTGSYPPATFLNLRNDYYVSSASFAATSQSYWSFAPAYPAFTASFYTLSGNLNASGSRWDSASSSFSSTQVSYNALSSSFSGAFFTTGTNTWVAASGGRIVLSGSNGSGTDFIGHVEMSEDLIVTGTISGSKAVLTGTIALAIDAGEKQWLSWNNTGGWMLRSLPSRGYTQFVVTAQTAALYSKGHALIYADDNVGEIRAAYVSGVDDSEFRITAGTGGLRTGVEIIANSPTPVYVHGNSAWDFNVPVYVSGTSPEAQALDVIGSFYVTGNLSGYAARISGSVNVSGNINVTGAISATSNIVISGTLYASGGVNAGSAKITNVGAGTVGTDAVNYGQFQPVSSTIVAVSQAVLLQTDPVISSQFTASYTGTLIQSEVWKKFTGELVKSSSYTYYPANILSQSFVSVFNDAGVTIIAQMTSTYFYSGTVLLSATISRTI